MIYVLSVCDRLKPGQSLCRKNIDEAIEAGEEGKEKIILFNYSGHGLMDLTGYDAYLSGKLTDYKL